MGESLVDKIKEASGLEIEPSRLSRMLKGERPATEEERAAINKVLGRESPFYPHNKDLEIAEQKIRDLERELKTSDPAWKFHALTPRIIAAWITFLLIFLSIVYAPPLLDLIVMRRSAGVIITIEEYAARAAEAEARLELYEQVTGEMMEDWQEIYERLEVDNEQDD